MNGYRLARLAVGAIGGLACTVHDDRLNEGDAATYYVAPSLCEKQKECIPATFALAYPGGVEECKTKLLESVPDRDKLSACTNEDYQVCRADIRNAKCPTDPAAAGLPPMPGSCSKC